MEIEELNYKEYEVLETAAKILTQLGHAKEGAQLGELVQEIEEQIRGEVHGSPAIGTKFLSCTRHCTRGNRQ